MTFKWLMVTFITPHLICAGLYDNDAIIINADENYGSILLAINYLTWFQIDYLKKYHHKIKKNFNTVSIKATVRRVI